MSDFGSSVFPPFPLSFTSQHATRPARPALVPPRPTAPPAPRWPPYRTATAGRAAKRGFSSTLPLESATVSQPVCVCKCVFLCLGVWMEACIFLCHLWGAFIKYAAMSACIFSLSGPGGNRTPNSGRVSTLLCPAELCMITHTET